MAKKKLDLASALAVLRKWAEFETRFCQRGRNAFPDLHATKQIIQACGKLFEIQAQELRALLQKSNQFLSPFGDPLLVDFGGHRWLAEDREEAYSDWLHWIIEQVREPEMVFRILGEPFDATQDWRDFQLDVRREFFVREGHVGRTGRIDLRIEYANKATFVVEIKRTDVEHSDLAKHIGYAKSLKNQPHAKPPILIATDDAQLELEEGFRYLPWRAVCVEMRKIVPRLFGANQSTIAAMILAFVAAVEQNLLGFNAAAVKGIMSGRVVPFNIKIVGHLNQALHEES